MPVDAVMTACPAELLSKIETLLWLAEGRPTQPIKPTAAVTVDIENAQPVKIESSELDMWIRQRERIFTVEILQTKKRKTKKQTI